MKTPSISRKLCVSRTVDSHRTFGKAFFCLIAIVMLPMVASAVTFPTKITTVNGSTVTQAQIDATVPIYVDALNGNNSNNGSTSSLAVKTIEKGVDLAVAKLNSGTATRLIVASGTYHEGDRSWAMTSSDVQTNIRIGWRSWGPRVVNSTGRNTLFVIEGVNRDTVFLKGSASSYTEATDANGDGITSYNFAPGSWTDEGGGVWSAPWPHKVGVDSNQTDDFFYVQPLGRKQELLIIRGTNSVLPPCWQDLHSPDGTIVPPQTLIEEWTDSSSANTALGAYLGTSVLKTGQWAVADQGDYTNQTGVAKRIYVKVDSGFNLNSATGLTIEVGIFDRAVYFGEHNKLVLKNLTFTGYCGKNTGGAFLTYDCDNVTVDNVVFHTNGGHALKLGGKSVDAAPNDTGITIRNVRSDYNGSNGVQVSACNDVLIDGLTCRFNNVRGPLVGEYGWFRAGIKFSHVWNVKANNLALTDNETNGFWTDIYCFFYDVTNLKAERNRECGAVVEWTSQLAMTGTGNLIADNAMGLLLMGSHDCVFDGVKIENNLAAITLYDDHRTTADFRSTGGNNPRYWWPEITGITIRNCRISAYDDQVFNVLSRGGLPSSYAGDLDPHQKIYNATTTAVLAEFMNGATPLVAPDTDEGYAATQPGATLENNIYSHEARKNAFFNASLSRTDFAGWKAAWPGKETGSSFTGPVGGSDLPSGNFVNDPSVEKIYVDETVNEWHFAEVDLTAHPNLQTGSAIHQFQFVNGSDATDMGTQVFVDQIQLQGTAGTKVLYGDAVSGISLTGLTSSGTSPIYSGTAALASGQIGNYSNARFNGGGTLDGYSKLTFYFRVNGAYDPLLSHFRLQLNNGSSYPSFDYSPVSGGLKINGRAYWKNTGSVTRGYPPRFQTKSAIFNATGEATEQNVELQPGKRYLAQVLAQIASGGAGRFAVSQSGVELAGMDIDPRHGQYNDIYPVLFEIPEGASPVTVTVSAKQTSSAGEVRVDGFEVVEAPEELPLDVVTGMVARWKLNETSGTTAADSKPSGTLYPGTLMGNASWTTGQVGGAVLLDGAGDYVQVPDNAQLHGQAMSFAAWVRTDTLDSSARGILSKRISASSGRAFSIFINTSNKRLFVDIGNAANTSQASRLDTGINWTTGWRHLVVVFDGSLTSNRVKVYLNGSTTPSYQANPSTYTTIPDTTAPLTIGTLTAGTGAGWNGRIDDVRIYNRALTPDEVATIAGVTE